MLIIGHRGARGLAPENTIASFQAALDNKVDGIEFDIRTTKDNVAVAVHDNTLDKLPVAGKYYDELKTAYKDLLTLKEVLDFIDNRVNVVVEIKPKAAVEPVIIALQDSIIGGWDQDKISVSSFDMKTLKQLKKTLPELRLIVNEPWSGVRASHHARKLGTKYITMNQKWLWSGFIKSVVRGDYKLSAYTVNNPDKAKKWAKHGLHAAITDYPDKF